MASIPAGELAITAIVEIAPESSPDRGQGRYMTEPSETFRQSLERIAEGGVLRLIVSKPVQQAIGRLIYGATDVPVAYLEQWSQSIRSDTAARKQITSAIVKAAVAPGTEDPKTQN